jgi:hypothetical protein
MPEFTVKEVHLPELRMPEIKRDDIVRSLSGIRLPEVDLAKARDVQIKVPTSIKVPTLALTSADVGKLLAAGTAVVRFVRPAPRRPGPLGLIGRRSRVPSVRILQPRRRRRWRLVGGLAILAAIGAFLALRRPQVRARAEAAVRDARSKIEEFRAGEPRETEGGMSQTPAADEAYTASVEVAGVRPAAEEAGTAADAPDDLSADSPATPAFEESSTSS